jgi:hypothetical protein
VSAHTRHGRQLPHRSHTCFSNIETEMMVVAKIL